MRTIISKIYGPQDEEKIREAAEYIKNGGIVAFPTETVYGLGADALNEKAVKKIFVAKGRPQDNPLIVHVASKNLNKYVENVPDIAKKMMDKFWPGPLTIILKKKNIIPNITSANLDTIGVRMPDNEVARKLIEFSDTVIAAPSANISGRPSPTDIERCVEDLDGKVDYILGGQKSKVGVESTIVDCTVNPPVILRPGGLTLEMLKEVDPNIELDKGLMTKPTEDFKPKAPGMKYKHYAPIADMVIVKGKTDDVVRKINEISDDDCAVLCCKETYERYISNNKLSAGSINDPSEIASNIFQCLRLFDQMKIKKIFCEYFEMKDIGEAVMNRLLKAASQNIIKV